LGTMQAPVLVKAGEATFQTPGFGAARPGDYSSVSVDPVTGTSFWAVNDYATVKTFKRNWGTWVANFSLGAGSAPAAQVSSLSSSASGITGGPSPMLMLNTLWSPDHTAGTSGVGNSFPG